MRSGTVVFSFVITLLSASRCGAQESGAPSGEPLYRSLYEQGFYAEAIALLDSLIAADTTGGNELPLYLAFCHVARGDRDAGAAVFERMLDRDPEYRLDTLLTPPKILDVFRAVRERRADRAPPSAAPAVTVDTAVERAQAAAAVPSILPPVAGPVNPATVSGVKLDTGKVDLHPALRYPLGLLPGGAGQFSRRRPIKGTLLLVAQCAATVCWYWAYRTRETYFEGGPSGHGWYEENEAPYRRYTNFARMGVGIFIGSYTVGIIDYFLALRNNRTVSQRQEGSVQCRNES